MYEFRFYAVSHGRMAEELALVHDMAAAGAPDVPGGKPTHEETLWQRYGVPGPIGSWTVLSGARAPGFLYIIKWDSLTQRDAHFPRFWTDPFWRARRGQLTDGQTLVEQIETWLLDPSPVWARVREGGSVDKIGGVHELRVQEILDGSVADAVDALANVELPFLKTSGARVLGVFDVVIGPRRPLIVTLLAWPDLESQHAAWAAFDNDAAILERRAADKKRLGRPLLGPCDQFLLEPVSFNMPSENLGAAE